MKADEINLKDVSYAFRWVVHIAVVDSKRNLKGKTKIITKESYYSNRADAEFLAIEKVDTKRYKIVGVVSSQALELCHAFFNDTLKSLTADQRAMITLPELIHHSK